MSVNAGWAATATGTGAEVTATKAAVSGRQHIIYSLGVSFDEDLGSAFALVQLKDGETVRWSEYVDQNIFREFPKGIAATLGNAVTLVVAQAPTGGVRAAANFHGNTR